MKYPEWRSFRRLKIFLPRQVRPFIKGFLAKAGFSRFKHAEELNYWRQKYQNGKWIVGVGDYFEECMLRFAKETDQEFLAGKIVADFGCGPCGSLKWATKAGLRIGIDVLADLYSEFDIARQNMVYVESTEKHIPLPSSYIDVMFTMNALDHCSQLRPMCRELIRIIKPGGSLIASFNLNEPETFCEPQTLTEKKLDDMLLYAFKPLHRELVEEGHYLHFRGMRK